jgi:selenocysteine-specific elongation factor
MGTPEDILLQTASKLGPSPKDVLLTTSGLESEPGKAALTELINQGVLVALDGGRLIFTQMFLSDLRKTLTSDLMTYHQEFPLRPGMARERLRSQVRLDAKVFDALITWLAEEGTLVESGAELRLSQHQVKFSPAQQAKIETLMRDFNAQPYSPPSYKQSSDILGEELLRALIITGQLSRVGDDVLFQPHVFDEMHTAVITHIQQKGSITLGELRDKFNTSRKYAVAVLEYLDQAGVTIRQGDTRILAG